MSNNDMGRQTDDKSGGKSAQGGTDPAAKRTTQRPEPPGEASGSGQEATRGSPSGEKLHGEKLQSASGDRSGGGSQGSSQGGQSGSHSGTQSGSRGSGRQH